MQQTTHRESISNPLSERLDLVDGRLLDLLQQLGVVAHTQVIEDSETGQQHGHRLVSQRTHVRLHRFNADGFSRN